jgi:hypothetical protein
MPHAGKICHQLCIFAGIVNEFGGSTVQKIFVQSAFIHPG